MQRKYSNEFLLDGLSFLLNERLIMVIETKNDQEIIYFGKEEKILNSTSE